MSSGTSSGRRRTAWPTGWSPTANGWSSWHGGYRRVELQTRDVRDGTAHLFFAATVDRHGQEDRGLRGRRDDLLGESWRLLCRICWWMIGLIGQRSIRTWRESKAT